MLEIINKIMEFTLKEKKNSKKSEKIKKTSKSSHKKTSEVVSLPLKRLNESVCPCCEWPFPQEFGEEEMSMHVELCLEGKGAKDIIRYKKKLKKKENNMKKKRKHKKEMEKIFNSYANNEPLEEPYYEEGPIVDIPKCPHCNLSIKNRDQTFVSIHLKKCPKEQKLFFKSIDKSLVNPYKDLMKN
jgi:hypothetical protein